MPSIACHMIVAKLVSEKLNIKSDDYIIGNLLPDIAKSKEESHKKVQGNYFLVPDIKYFKETLDLKNKTDLGILTHLLLDKHFLEEFMPHNNKLFEDKTIYKEYDLLNYKLIKKFNLDVDYLVKILSNFNSNIDKDKLKLNLNCLTNKETGNTVYLKLDEVSNFLFEVSDKICEEIKEYAG